MKVLAHRLKALAQGVHPILDRLQLHPQHLGGRGAELVQGQAGVAVVQVMAQHIEDPRLNPSPVVHRLFHGLSNGVGNVEADVDPLAAQAVRVLLNAGHRGLPELLPHQHRLLGPHAVRAQEHHQLPNAVDPLQFLSQLFGLLLGDSLDLSQALRVLFYHLQGLVPEGLDYPPGHGRTNALQSAGGKILQHGSGGGGPGTVEGFRLELVPKRRMALPSAVDPQLLPFADKGERPHHRDHAPLRGKVHHGVLIFVVVICHMVHRAAKLQQHLFLFRQGTSPVTVCSFLPLYDTPDPPVCIAAVGDTFAPKCGRPHPPGDPPSG